MPWTRSCSTSAQGHRRLAAPRGSQERRVPRQLRGLDRHRLRAAIGGRADEQATGRRRGPRAGSVLLAAAPP